MNLGEKIYELRTEKGLSQGDLADELDVSRQSVSKWENNTAVPDLDKLIKLCDIFEISLDELTGREQTKAEPKEKETNTIKDFKNSLTKTQRIGCILIGAAILSIIVPMGRFLTLPIALCGVICLLVKKQTWYWCVWAAYLPVQLLLDFFGLGLGFSPIIAAVFMVIMVFITYNYLKDIKFNMKKKTRILLFALSLVYAIAHIIIMWILPFWEMHLSSNRVNSVTSGIIYAPVNFVLTILLGAGMIHSVCFIRELREKKKNNT